MAEDSNEVLSVGAPTAQVSTDRTQTADTDSTHSADTGRTIDSALHRYTDYTATHSVHTAQVSLSARHSVSCRLSLQQTECVTLHHLVICMHIVTSKPGFKVICACSASYRMLCPD